MDLMVSGTSHKVILCAVSSDSACLICAFCRLSRFFGCCTVDFALLRWRYWPEAFERLGSPLVLWSLAAFLLNDTTYGVCLYMIPRAERKPLRLQ